MCVTVTILPLHLKALGSKFGGIVCLVGGVSSRPDSWDNSTKILLLKFAVVQEQQTDLWPRVKLCVKRAHRMLMMKKALKAVLLPPSSAQVSSVLFFPLNFYC